VAVPAQFVLRGATVDPSPRAVVEGAAGSGGTGSTGSGTGSTGRPISHAIFRPLFDSAASYLRLFEFETHKTKSARGQTSALQRCTVNSRGSASAIHADSSIYTEPRHRKWVNQATHQSLEAAAAPERGNLAPGGVEDICGHRLAP
jgi:hypothetical protein